MPSHIGLLVHIHGLGRWGTGLTPEAIRERVERALREEFPQRDFDEDIEVDIDEAL